MAKHRLPACSRRLARAALVLGVSSVVFAACKRSTANVTLKGLTADQTTKEIDYPTLLASGKTLTYTNLISYESSYQNAAGTPAASDQGTLAVYKYLDWLTNNANPNIFAGRMTVTQNTFPDQASVQMGQIYRYSALIKAVQLAYTFRGQPQTATVDVQLNEILGAALGTDQAMPDDFRTELANALVTADVVSYNGHIWTANIPSDPHQQAPADDNTQALADALKGLGGRAKYGIIYMNACNGEAIEQAMMGGLLSGDQARAQPILLSHRNESNFGFFADHDGFLLMDTLAAKPLQKLMLDFTSTLGHPELAVDPRDPFSRTRQQAPGAYVAAKAGVASSSGDDTAASAAAKLAAYYQASNAYNDSLQVMVVAYDMAGGKLQQSGADPSTVTQ